jgi:hypothetical protein
MFLKWEIGMCKWILGFMIRKQGLNTKLNKDDFIYVGSLFVFIMGKHNSRL